MKPRRWRSLLYILAALQLLMSAPIASAFSAHPQAPATATGDDSCPCCPEGTAETANCLSACTAAYASIATLPTRVATAPQPVVEMPPHLPLARTADPPLDPPPIS